MSQIYFDFHDPSGFFFDGPKSWQWYTEKGRADANVKTEKSEGRWLHSRGERWLVLGTGVFGNSPYTLRAGSCSCVESGSLSANERKALQDSKMSGEGTTLVACDGNDKLCRSRKKNFERLGTFAYKSGVSNIRTAFPLGASNWVAWSVLDSQQGDQIAWSLDKKYKGCRKQLQALTAGGIKFATFGVDHSWFIMTKRGNFGYNLQKSYSQLEHHLKGLQDGDITFLALSPYRSEQFFLLRADNTAIFRVPLAYRKTLTETLEANGITCLPQTDIEIGAEKARDAAHKDAMLGLAVIAACAGCSVM